MRRLLLFFLCALLAAPALAFNQSHAAWNALLNKHVKEQHGGVATQVDYTGFKRDAEALDRYTKSLSAVSAAEFGKFDRLIRWPS